MYLLLVVSVLVLFMVSLFADRVFRADTVAKWTFGLGIVPLFLLMQFFMLDLILGSPPLELGFIEFSKWSASKFGGWSRFLAANYFCAALVSGTMFLLSWFVNAVESPWYGIIALMLFVNSLVFLIGFFVFFEALALILGIAATIIGILVGLKKLI